MNTEAENVIRFEMLTRGDVASVGGKNASLGELIAKLGEAGIRVPGGFASSASAYRRFIRANALAEPIAEQIGKLKADLSNLAEIGDATRKMILAGSFPADLENDIRESYRAMGNGSPARVAVRSSATAEDLPEASFAGQLETFLNVHGEDALLTACKQCYASLFTDRAISYRENNRFDHLEVALSVGVQAMVRWRVRHCTTDAAFRINENPDTWPGLRCELCVD